MSGQAVVNRAVQGKGNGTRARIPELKARAFRAYLEVMETAAWFRHQVEPQLADFDLNRRLRQASENDRALGSRTHEGNVKRERNSKIGGAGEVRP